MKNKNENKKTEIPGNAFIHCPAKRFSLVRASHCAKCNYFKGAVEHQKTNNFFQDTRFACTHPIHRRLECVEV